MMDLFSVIGIFACICAGYFGIRVALRTFDGWKRKLALSERRMDSFGRFVDTAEARLESARNLALRHMTEMAGVQAEACGIRSEMAAWKETVSTVQAEVRALRAEVKNYVDEVQGLSKRIKLSEDNRRTHTTAPPRTVPRYPQIDPDVWHTPDKPKGAA